MVSSSPSQGLRPYCSGNSTNKKRIDNCSPEKLRQATVGQIFVGMDVWCFLNINIPIISFQRRQSSEVGKYHYTDEQEKDKIILSLNLQVIHKAGNGINFG